MFYKYTLLFNNQKYLYSKSFLIASLGLLLCANKSFASDYYSTINLDKEYLYDCLKARCLTLNSYYKPFNQNQTELAENLTLDIDKGKFDNPNVWLGQGIDRLDPFPSQKNFSLHFSNQVLPTMTLSSVIEHGSKKENAKAMLNQINVWRAGSSLYWKLTNNTVLSNSVLLGNYNDGNKDLQTYSRIDQNFGSFSLSADLSTASYEQDLETSSGYFSPSNYLLYSAEAAWKQIFFDSSTCKLALRAGEQKLLNDLSKVYSVGSFCDVVISDKANLDFSYSLANVSGAERKIYHDFTGTIRFTF